MTSETIHEARTLISKKFSSKKTDDFISRRFLPVLDERVLGKVDEELSSFLDNNDAVALQQAVVVDKKWSLVDVVKQCQMKAQQYRDHNSITYYNFNQALAQAEDLDAVLASADQSILEKKPLIGYIMSIKDSIFVKDTPSTNGLFRNLDRFPSEQPGTIRSLLNSGAILLVKGNVPQFLFSCETNNNVFGSCSAPNSGLTRNSAGSSGGDSCNVGLKIVNAAIGSDIGGSLRTPALSCGVCSLKPSPGRLSYQSHSGSFDRRFGSPDNNGFHSVYSRQTIVVPTIGPIARSVTDLEALMKAMVRDQSYDAKIVPRPWQPAVLKKRVGVVRGISKICSLSKSAERALSEAVLKLQGLGYECVELEAMEGILGESGELCLKAFMKDELLMNSVTGSPPLHEPVTPALHTVQLLSRVPKSLAALTSWIKGDKDREGYLLRLRVEADRCSSADIEQAAEKLYSEIMELMRVHDLDGFVAPGMPCPALLHGQSKHLMLICVYFFAWNLMNMPCGVVSTTRVQEGEAEYEDLWQDSATDEIRRCLQNAQSMSMGVCVTARPFHEETALAIMRDLE